MSAVIPSPAVLLLFASHPGALLAWAAVLMLVATLLVFWATEAMQLFMPPGLAFALLAFFQTLPELSVESILAWHGRVHLLLAGLTGAIRLLIGFTVPASFAVTKLRGHSSLQFRMPATQRNLLYAWLAAWLYAVSLGIRGALSTPDGLVLWALYAWYVWTLRRQSSKPEQAENIESWLQRVCAMASGHRAALLGVMLAVGGFLIYFSSPRLLDGILRTSAVIGIPAFVSLQWIAPLISEFPETMSSLRWAAKPREAALALSNVASSNLSQWTILAGSLPLIFALSPHANWMGRIPMSSEQMAEWWLTLAQSAVLLVLLFRGVMRTWEASLLFGLWGAQFFTSPFPYSALVRTATTAAFAIWAVIAALQLLRRPRTGNPVLL